MMGSSLMRAVGLGGADGGFQGGGELGLLVWGERCAGFGDVEDVESLGGFGVDEDYVDAAALVADGGGEVV